MAGNSRTYGQGQQHVQTRTHIRQSHRLWQRQGYPWKSLRRIYPTFILCPTHLWRECCKRWWYDLGWRHLRVIIQEIDLNKWDHSAGGIRCMNSGVLAQDTRIRARYPVVVGPRNGAIDVYYKASKRWDMAWTLLNMEPRVPGNNMDIHPGQPPDAWTVKLYQSSNILSIP